MALDLTKYLTQEQIAAKIKDCQSNWALKILELDLAKKATLATDPTSDTKGFDEQVLGLEKAIEVADAELAELTAVQE